jgi:hypothetical protein
MKKLDELTNEPPRGGLLAMIYKNIHTSKNITKISTPINISLIYKPLRCPTNH